MQERLREDRRPPRSIRRNKVRSLGSPTMRVLHKDPNTGEIKVRVENADDLWHLHNLVLPGDHVRHRPTAARK